MMFDITTAIIGGAIALCGASAVAAVIAAAERKTKLCLMFTALLIAGAVLIGGFGGGLQ